MATFRPHPKFAPRRVAATRGVPVSEVAGELAILAGRCGLVANNAEGRQAFGAWLANDHVAARKALFGRVAAQQATKTRQVAASMHAPTKATKYPAGWLRAAAQRATTPTKATMYPAGWLRAAGVLPGRSGRINEAND